MFPCQGVRHLVLAALHRARPYRLDRDGWPTSQECVAGLGCAFRRRTPDTVIGWCLDPADLVVAKAVARRPKDHEFIKALVKAGLVSPAEALRRLAHIDHGTNVPSPTDFELARIFLASLPSPPRVFKTTPPHLPKGRRRPTRADFVRPADEYADHRQARAALDSARLPKGAVARKTRCPQTNKTTGEYCGNWLLPGSTCPAHD